MRRIKLVHILLLLAMTATYFYLKEDPKPSPPAQKKLEPRQKPITENIMPPVLAAAMQKNYPALESLLAQGGDVNAADTGGFNPLLYAVYSNDKTLTDYLLGKNANINFINNQGSSPLSLALQMQNNDMAMHLIIKGANVNAAAKDKATPLQIAQAAKNPDQFIIKILISKGAK
jgi:ankyrin repeat protein